MGHTFTLIEPATPAAIDKCVTLGDLKALVAALDSAGVDDKVTVFNDEQTAYVVNQTKLELLNDEDLNEGLAMLESIIGGDE